MFNINKNKAEYKEKIKESYVEEITDHAENSYFDGYVVFNYDSIKNVVKTKKINGIEKTVKYLVLETQSDLPFKNFDEVRLDGRDVYEITDVDIKINDKFKSLIAINPEIRKRYEYKVLTLHAS